jgi:hypothetical protein
VAARGWEVEAVVSNYDEESFALADGVPEVSALTLEEIFIALTGEAQEGDR